MRIEHLNDTERRVLRLAVNRLGEKGEWNLDELKIEFEELIVADAPIEASGFALDEIDHIVLAEVATRSKRGLSRRRRTRSLSPALATFLTSARTGSSAAARLNLRHCAV